MRTSKRQLWGLPGNAGNTPGCNTRSEQRPPRRWILEASARGHSALRSSPASQADHSPCLGSLELASETAAPLLTSGAGLRNPSSCLRGALSQCPLPRGHAPLTPAVQSHPARFRGCPGRGGAHAHPSQSRAEAFSALSRGPAVLPAHGVKSQVIDNSYGHTSVLSLTFSPSKHPVKPGPPVRAGCAWGRLGWEG